ncbi:hypothetical protein [Streptomyces sp. Inha503]|uniref:hypothetical protein n=1 Tax=Streptomyces sp. Inha503 TaxID=3383314 RepID=UPI00399FCFF0
MTEMTDKERMIRALYEEQAGLTSGRPLRPWLFRVTRDLVVDDYRLRMDTDEVPGADERGRAGEEPSEQYSSAA